MLRFLAAPNISQSPSQSQSPSVSSPAVSSVEWTPTPEPKTSHLCLFELDPERLRYNDNKLKNARYRSLGTRASGKKFKPSWVWAHGADIEADGFERLFVCKHCHVSKRPVKHIFAADKATTTTANHLRSIHGLEDPEVVIEKTKKRKRRSLQTKLKPFNNLQYKRNLCWYLICFDKSLTHIRKRQARDFWAQGREEIEAVLPRSDTTIRKWILDLYQDQKKIIDHRFLKQAYSKINISCDAWKAGKKHNYLGVAAHFVQEGKVKHLLLGLKRYSVPKTGENSAELLADLLDSWSITDLGAVTGDNATDNDTLVRALRNYFPNLEIKRTRCLGHIINLIVKACLFGEGVNKFEDLLDKSGDEDAFKLWASKGPIGKLHNIAVYILRSPDRRRQFLKKQRDRPYPLLIITDGGIRWNSTFEMIQRGLELREAIISFCNDYEPPSKGYDLTESFLTREDWYVLEVWKEFLSEFNLFTKTEEYNAGNAGYHGMLCSLISGLSSVYELFDEVETRVKNDPKLNSNEHFKSAILVGRAKLMDYFVKLAESDIYYAAIALNPAWRTNWFKIKWDKWEVTWVDDGIAAFRRMYDQYEAEYLAAQSPPPKPKLEPIVLDDPQLAKQRNRFIEYNQLVLPMSTRGARSKKRKGRSTEASSSFDPHSEYDRYTMTMTQQDTTIRDPIRWWWEHRSEYPVLSKMAFDVLSIPAMSAELERVFSHTARLITDERSDLEEDIVNAMESCKQWALHGFTGPEGVGEDTDDDDDDVMVL